jgi:CMP/dCMP kinase
VVRRRPPPRLVTVDGPAGSGKTTLGRRLAGLLGVPLVDTGALYRAIAVAAADRHIEADDTASLAGLARALRIDMDTDPFAVRPRVTVDGDDISDRLRDPSLAPLLGAVSRAPSVRSVLLEVQRRFAPGGEAVAVGRDCGTVVFPEAPVKLYLDASPAVREERRARQLAARYGPVGESVLLAEVEARDRADAGRAAAPMRPASDAVVIRTDTLGIEAMVDAAVAACGAAGILP